MDVLKFKRTGDVYFVQYEENEDLKTLKTEDEPETDLVTAMDNVALALLKLFSISDVACKLQAIEWKDGEKAGSKCVLLSGESMFGQFKLALPKVSTQEAETPEDGIYDPDSHKNDYNAAADRLREEVKRFLTGARRQRTLPFKGEGEGDEAPKGKKRGKGIIQAAADKVGGLFNPQS
jgi:protein-tyrosine-phosphatase